MNLRAIAFGGAIGLVVPIALLGYHILTNQLADSSTFLLWPSSIMLLATESMPLPESMGVLAQSVLINVFLYAVIGGVIGLVCRKRDEHEV